MQLTAAQITDFLEALWSGYAQHARRDLPWRIPESDGAFDPYKIMVSELMLQQTQVPRVVPKYQTFVSLFPTAEALASADLGDVLAAWQGLGYNRRAKYLWLAARHIASKGWPADLTELPGVGSNTAGAIRAYAFNEPVIFIETNIRTVYIHTFLQNHRDVVDDAVIRELLAQTLDKEQPREFYWALMDWGTRLKAVEGNLSRRSRHYVKQSVFVGSRRQVRGAVLRSLTGSPKTFAELAVVLDDDRLEAVLADLVAENMIRFEAAKYHLGGNTHE